MGDVKSKLKVLLEDASQFTYENFSTKGEYGYPQEYLPEWVVWENRVKKLLLNTFKNNSAPVKLLELFHSTNILGNGEDKFNQAQYSITEALKVGIEILDNDDYEEIIDNLTTEKDPLKNIRKILSRFHLVARQLRYRHDERETLDIDDEYDVQDLIHSLLKLFFDDIRPEEVTPSYAGKSSRMDFLLKNEEIAVEIKKTRKGLVDKEIGTQLIEDIARYKEHHDCKTLICFVYDPEERIKNPIGLENDLSRNIDGLNVEVIIAPKGY